MKKKIDAGGSLPGLYMDYGNKFMVILSYYILYTCGINGILII
jgi:hypothetical protein